MSSRAVLEMFSHFQNSTIYDFATCILNIRKNKVHVLTSVSIKNVIVYQNSDIFISKTKFKMSLRTDHCNNIAFLGVFFPSVKIYAWVRGKGIHNWIIEIESISAQFTRISFIDYFGPGVLKTFSSSARFCSFRLCINSQIFIE